MVMICWRRFFVSSWLVSSSNPIFRSWGWEGGREGGREGRRVRGREGKEKKRVGEREGV